MLVHCTLFLVLNVLPTHEPVEKEETERHELHNEHIITAQGRPERLIQLSQSMALVPSANYRLKVTIEYFH